MASSEIVQSAETSYLKAPSRYLLFFATEARGQAIIQYIADSFNSEERAEYVETLVSSLKGNYKTFAENNSRARQFKRVGKKCPVANSKKHCQSLGVYD